MKMNTDNKQKLSLISSVSLGTGVMIGAGIFVLMGQIAELVGALFPIAFIGGAIIAAFSSYSYVKFSNAYPSSGGVAKFLTKAYGPGRATGVFSLLMYISMVVAESLVAGTFGAYTLRLFSPQYAGYASALGVALIVVAYIVNILGNKVVGNTATVTAIIKIGGIALLAIVGLANSGFASISGNTVPKGAGDLPPVVAFAAALALSILAFKGFTTITNQGDDVRNPKQNVGRSIIISIVICTVLYVALALSVAGGLSVPQIIEAKDYALAAAARPVLGQWGAWLTIGIAIVATVSGIIASIYSASRLLSMLSSMKQIPDLKRLEKVGHPALIFTAGLAIILTIALDLTRIASIGAIFYLVMDIAIHWGLFRHLQKEVDFHPIVPLIAIIMDAIVLFAFIYVKYLSDPLVLVVAAVGITLVALGEHWFMLSHTDSSGKMHMGMDENADTAGMQMP